MIAAQRAGWNRRSVTSRPKVGSAGTICAAETPVPRKALSQSACAAASSATCVRHRPIAAILVLLAAGCANSRVATGPPVDPEFAQSASAARAAFDRGYLPQAIDLYTRALRRARAMDEAQKIADASYNLAACLCRTRAFDAARTLLHESEAESTRAGLSPADGLLLEARIARLRHEPRDAAALADRVLALDEKAPEEDRVGAYVIKGEIALEAGDPVSAAADLAAGRQLPRAAADPASAADVAGLDGMLLRAKGDPAAAAARFDEQSDLLRKAAIYDDLPAALSRAGEAYAASSRPANAADRYYRAARTALAQGDATNAAAWAVSAQSVATAAGDRSLLERIATLRAELTTAASRPD